MMIFVKGKGCFHCPFYDCKSYEDMWGENTEELCKLHSSELNMKPTNIANCAKRPDDCPFKDGSTIEVIAEDPE